MKTKNRILTATNYTYLEPVNATHAKKEATKWGSSSNYINHLIAKDRGDKASMQRSKDLQEEFFTPALARTKKDRKGEGVGKKKAAKKTKAKKSKAAAKPRKKAAKKVLSKATRSTRKPVTLQRALKKQLKKIAKHQKSLGKSRISLRPRKATSQASASA